MTVTLVGVFIIALGLSASTDALISWLVCTLLFGATAAAALPALGGATILPSSLFIPFIAYRAWKERPLDLRNVTPPDFWLWSLIAWSVLAAMLLPTLFQGETMVMTVDRSTGSQAVMLIKAKRTPGNVTQTVYMLGGGVLFTAVRSALHSRKRQLRMANAVLLVGVLNIVAAIINLAEFYLPIPSILSGLRTASYASFDNAAVNGLVRIQGTFSEASTFAGFTMPIFAFSTQLWFGQYRPRLSGAVALVSLLLLALSTSTTAYAGTALYLGLLAITMARHALLRGAKRYGFSLLFAALTAPIAAWLVVSLLPSLTDGISDMVERMVFSKLDSSSGKERSAWNWHAFQNFIDTFGVGIGTGSARASSYPLSLLSNLGVLGALCFAGFLSTLLAMPNARLKPEVAVVNAAARHALLIYLIALTLAGTVIYPGEQFFVYAGIAASWVPRRGASGARASALGEGRLKRSGWRSAAPSSLRTT